MILRGMKSPDRVAAKRYADEHGFFWLACPRCGEYFGGHEWETENVQCVQSPTTMHGACCPKVSDDADREACRRAHEQCGEEWLHRSVDK